MVGTVASNKYVIKAYNEATEDLNQVIETFEDIEIAKATIPADAYTEPVAKNVRTTGAAQDLVDAATWTGETTYGTFQYSLTNNGTDWSTDVPQGTGVAEYTVYWRILPTVVSDTRNYNIVSGSVAAKIENKSTVTIAAKANQTFGYGTTPVIDYTTVWTEQGSDELNVTGMEWKWYTNSDCSTPATEDGHGNFTVGDYYVKATGAIVTGTTAASQEIVYTPVAVKITAGQVTAKTFPVYVITSCVVRWIPLVLPAVLSAAPSTVPSVLRLRSNNRRRLESREDKAHGGEPPCTLRKESKTVLLEILLRNRLSKCS